MAENISAVEHECQESVITKVDQRQDTAVGGGYEVENSRESQEIHERIVHEKMNSMEKRIRGLEQCLQRVMVELAQLKQHFLQQSGAEQNAGDIDANILWAPQ